MNRERDHAKGGLSVETMAHLALDRLATGFSDRVTPPTFPTLLGDKSFAQRVRQDIEDVLTDLLGIRVTFKSNDALRRFCLGSRGQHPPLIDEYELLAQLFAPHASHGSSCFRLDQFGRELIVGSYSDYQNIMAEEFRLHFEDPDHHPPPPIAEVAALRNLIMSRFSGYTEQQLQDIVKGAQFRGRPTIDGENWIASYRRHFDCLTVTDEAIQKRANRGRAILGSRPTLRLRWLRIPFPELDLTETSFGWEVWQDGKRVQKISGGPWIEYWYLLQPASRTALPITATEIGQKSAFWPSALLRYEPIEPN